ncbi:MAG: hypothetical protein HY263_06075 [Chloroflexi bacterium]|nr:hypothetical protein [Chloroflexota bacterium]
MNTLLHPADRRRPALGLGLTVLVALAALAPVPAFAHGPDPLFGTRTWYQNQVVGYTWASGYVPPSWMIPAIDAGATDVGESRASRAATFARQSGAPSPVAYSATMPCPSYAIACVDRTGVPVSFAGLWFRPHGWTFDWGTLRWCQAQSTFTDGCYDVENVMLDELGHIEILGHHVNYSDGSDFTDAVVQASAHSRPKAGWNQHVFGDCDVARLELEYERQTASDPVSDCLNLATALSLSISPTSVYVGATVAFSSTLKITLDTTTNRAMAGDPLSRRSVLLQRRPLGSTTWTTVTTMYPSAATDGLYTVLWSPTATYDWRALFPTPANEGLVGSTSAITRVTVSGCSGSGCPSSLILGAGQ